jgi:hypothetical protein
MREKPKAVLMSVTARNVIQQTVKQSELKLREVPGTRTEYRRYELEWAPVQ